MALTYPLCVFIFYLLVSLRNLSTARNVSDSHVLKRATTEVKCANGKILQHESLLCDGVRNCEDNSDESARFCSHTLCRKDEFRCDYGGCLEGHRRCNAVYDCWDNSDELGCNFDNVTFGKYGIQCQNGQRILNEDVCNGVKDCEDGSEESPKLCENWLKLNQEFKCSDGLTIKHFSTCDTLRHCADGSDESSILCATKVCASSQFRCAYGGCVHQSRRCDGLYHCRDNSDEYGCDNDRDKMQPSITRNKTDSPVTYKTTPTTITAGSCTLPSFPDHGSYTVHSTQCVAGDDCSASPGTLVNNGWVLRYSCHSGYSLDRDTMFTFCDNGTWINKGECIKLCPPLTSKTLTVECSYDGREVPCEFPMSPGTKATVACSMFYRPAYAPEYRTLFCFVDGEWNHPLFQCSPVCGVPQGPVKPLVVHGQATKRGEYPWLAGIYSRTSDGFKHTCGGTLITPHIVLTAAHCVVTSLRNEPLRPSDMKVGLGKYYRDLNKAEALSVIADVREVIVRSQYVGSQSNYAQDIGLLDLVAHVPITAYVMPACIDWSNTFKPTSDALGVVAGWGSTGEGKSSSEVLAAELSFIKYQDCLKMLKASKKGLLTQDKFCAGSVNGSRVDNGDSGGGLTFIHNEQHFVIGIVSTKIVDVFTFTLFTDITSIDFMRWLEIQKNRLEAIHRQL